MQSPHATVADLVTKLHENISSIDACVQQLSDTSSHNTALEQLELEREQKIKELRAQHESAIKALKEQRIKEIEEVERKRKEEQDQIEEERRREWEEILAKRKREDEARQEKVKAEEEERNRVKTEEDAKREKEREEKENNVLETAEREMESLEDEMERKIEEGKRALAELDEQRRQINAEIDKAINTPTVIPTITFRSRAKTLKSPGKAPGAGIGLQGSPPKMGDIGKDGNDSASRDEGNENKDKSAQPERKEETTPDNLQAAEKDILVARVQTSESPGPRSETPEKNTLSRSQSKDNAQDNDLPSTKKDAPTESEHNSKATGHATSTSERDIHLDLEAVDGLSPSQNLTIEIEHKPGDFTGQGKTAAERDLTSNSEIVEASADSSSQENTSTAEMGDHDSKPKGIAVENKHAGPQYPKTESVTDRESPDIEKEPSVKFDFGREEKDLGSGHKVAESTECDGYAADKGTVSETEDESKTRLDEFKDEESSDIFPSAVSVAVDSDSTGAGDQNGGLEQGLNADAPSVEKSDSKPDDSPAGLADRGKSGDEFKDLDKSAIDDSKLPESVTEEVSSAESIKETHNPVFDTAPSVSENEKMRSADAGESNVLESYQPITEHATARESTSRDFSDEPPNLESKDTGEDRTGLDPGDQRLSVDRLQIEAPTPTAQDVAQGIESPSVEKAAGFKEVSGVVNGKEEFASTESHNKDALSLPVESGLPVASDVDNRHEFGSSSREDRDKMAKQSLSLAIGSVSADNKTDDMHASESTDDVLTGERSRPASFPTEAAVNNSKIPSQQATPISPSDCSSSHGLQLGTGGNEEGGPNPNLEPVMSGKSKEPELSSNIPAANSVQDSNVDSPDANDDKPFAEAPKLVPSWPSTELSESLPKDSPEVEHSGLNSRRDLSKLPSHIDIAIATSSHLPRVHKLDSKLESLEDEAEGPFTPHSEFHDLHDRPSDADLARSFADDAMMEPKEFPTPQKEAFDMKDLTDKPASQKLEEMTSSNTDNTKETGHIHEPMSLIEHKTAGAGHQNPQKTHEELILNNVTTTESANHHDKPAQPIRGSGNETDDTHRSVTAVEDDDSPSDTEVSHEFHVGGDNLSAEPIESQEVATGHDRMPEDQNLDDTSQSGPNMEAASIVDEAQLPEHGENSEGTADPLNKVSSPKQSADTTTVQGENDDLTKVSDLDVDEAPAPASMTTVRVHPGEDIQTPILNGDDNTELSNEQQRHASFDMATADKPIMVTDTQQGNYEDKSSNSEHFDDSRKLSDETEYMEERDRASVSLNFHDSTLALVPNTIQHSTTDFKEGKPVAQHMEDSNLTSSSSHSDDTHDFPLPTGAATPYISEIEELKSAESIGGKESISESPVQRSESPHGDKSMQSQGDDVTEVGNGLSLSESKEHTQQPKNGPLPPQDGTISSSPPIGIPNSMLQDAVSTMPSEQHFGESSPDDFTTPVDHANLQTNPFTSASPFSSGNPFGYAARHSGQDVSRTSVDTLRPSRDIITSAPSDSHLDISQPVTATSDAFMSAEEDHDQDSFEYQNHPALNWPLQRNGEVNVSSVEIHDPHYDDQHEINYVDHTPHEERFHDAENLLYHNEALLHAYETDSEHPSINEDFRQPDERPRTPHMHRFDPHIESPNTVLNTDQLFEDSSDDEALGYPSPEDIADEYVDGPAELDTVPEHEALQHFTDTPSRNSGLFANLVETIRPDIPIVRQMRDAEDDSQSISDYSQSTPARPLSVSFDENVRDYDEHPGESLHVRTHTADTIPSFESYAQSDSIPTTPSDAASSPFQEAHDEPAISSWRDTPELEDHQELKPQASPMQESFDRFNSTSYPNYISPKQSRSNLQIGTEPQLGLPTSDTRTTYLSPKTSQVNLNDDGSKQVKRTPSAEWLSLNTTAAQESNVRPYDSPVSATQSVPGELSPLAGTPPRRSIGPIITTPRMPVSSPSTPPNSFFQKTRSLFEAASAQSPPPVPARRLSVNSTGHAAPPPPPPRKSPSRPTSLYQLPPARSPLRQSTKDEGEEDLLIPRSLDGDGKPPSPVFTLPSRSGSISSLHRNEASPTPSPASKEDGGIRPRISNPFLGTLGRFVGAGLGGLEDSMHNPNRKEKEPLLGGLDDR